MPGKSAPDITTHGSPVVKVDAMIKALLDYAIKEPYEVLGRTKPDIDIRSSGSDEPATPIDCAAICADLVADYEGGVRALVKSATASYLTIASHFHHLG
jgi:hypothetical protein